MSNDRTGRGGAFSPVGVMLLALVWGFAEATLFFIVPDVLLTWLALSSTKQAWLATLWTLVGALLGGTVMYLWGMSFPAMALDAVEAVPGVNQEMCTKVEDQLSERGASAMFLGPLTGTPYKIYAVKSARLNIGYVGFLLISIPARWIRFALLTGLVIVLRWLLPRPSLRICQSIHLLLWGLFYLAYFTILVH